MSETSYTERTAVIRRALADWQERSLVNGLSIVVEGEGAGDIWTTERSKELIDRFVNSPDVTDKTFLQKLQGQLAEATTQSVQLMTELSWLYLVASMSLKPATKRKILSDIASIGGAALPSGVFDEALESGLVKTGASFNMHRPFQLWFLIRFAHEWLSLGKGEKQRLLGDAWAFREFVYSIEGSADAAMRHAICFYVHPDTFEPILSTSMKKKIVAGMGIPGDPDESYDNALIAIHRRVREEYGAEATLWDQRIRSQWDDSIEKSLAESKGDYASTENKSNESRGVPDGVDSESLVAKGNRRAWIVRGNSGESIPEWLELGRCAVYFKEMFPFPIEPGLSRNAIRERAEAVGVDTAVSSFNHSLGQVWRFVNEINPGDYVLTVRGQDIFLGVVESDALNVGAPARQQTYREIEWLNATKPIKRRDVSPEVYSKLRTLLTLSDISTVFDLLDVWVRNDFDPDALVQKIVDVKEVAKLVLPEPSVELASELLLDENWLYEQTELLRNKRQLIYYGPPGTGKTYLAMKLAEDLIRDGGEVELVQFHPSYTYEDFFEGYRPVASTAGHVAFEIRHGPLRRLAEMAELAPSRPHFLVIDEINRANIAKVFGELYFLLEYRSRSMTLQYSEKEFSLPGNLFVIGTMNTADRSIALIDAAMRRRFSFVEMSPAKQPVEGLLRRWLIANELSENAADLLDALNERIADPDASVGPSYLMLEDIDEAGCLERVWRYGIIPLLEERFHGFDDGNLGDFQLDFLRNRIAVKPLL